MAPNPPDPNVPLNHCPQCNYRLHEANHKDDRCPECGESFDDLRAGLLRDVARRKFEERMFWFLMVIACVIGLVLLFAVRLIDALTN